MDALPSLTTPRPAYDSTARRIGWTDLPRTVRDLIEEKVGGQARAEASAGTGFTPGFAARVHGAGGCTFVKAAGARQTPFAAESYLTEARINTLLPDAVPALRLRWSEQAADGWVVLGFDPIDGRIPHLPWRADELTAVLDAYAVTAEALTPAPDTFAATGLEKIAEHDDAFSFWRKLAGGEVDASRLPPFLEASWIDALAHLEAGWSQATDGASMLHNDLRADNILIDTTDAAFICDWNWAVLGAPWLDLTVLLAAAFTDGHDATTLLARHPTAVGTEPEQIDAALAAFAGMFVDRGGDPDVPESPALHEHQRFSAEALLRWLATRRRWPR